MWLNPSNPQLNKNGELHHLLTLEGLPAEILWQILDTAKSFVGVTQREVKKVPLLRGKAVFNLFFEPSTRTRTTFEIAAKRLSADVINLAINISSQTKGETVLDTVANLAAMQADMFIVRHAASGAPYLIAQHVAPEIHVINAGDGRHAHPTQGLLDMFTIRHYKQDFSAAARRDRRRHPALARRALADPRAHDARLPRDPRDRAEDPAARATSRASACTSTTTCVRA